MIEAHASMVSTIEHLSRAYGFDATFRKYTSVNSSDGSVARSLSVTIEDCRLLAKNRIRRERGGKSSRDVEYYVSAQNFSDAGEELGSDWTFERSGSLEVEIGEDVQIVESNGKPAFFIVRVPRGGQP